MGLNELHELEHAQAAAQRAGKPHLVRLDKDLSGLQALHLYIWRKYELKSMEPEHEVDVVTEIQICRRPVGGKVKQESRMRALREQGITVIPQSTDRNFAVELRLKHHSTYVTKPIKDVEASTSKEEEVDLVKGGYTKAPWSISGDWQEGMGKFGGAFGRVHLWVLKDDPKKPYAMKKAQGISRSPEYNNNVSPHYNQELQRVMEFLYLSENDVHLLWRLFKRMDILNEDTVWIDSLLGERG
jgi:hypothetical protein